jgi:hypothetical protein
VSVCVFLCVSVSVSVCVSVCVCLCVCVCDLETSTVRQPIRFGLLRHIKKENQIANEVFLYLLPGKLIKRPDDRFNIRYVEATKGSECITTVIIIEMPFALHDP